VIGERERRVKEKAERDTRVELVLGMMIQYKRGEFQFLSSTYNYYVYYYITPISITLHPSFDRS